MHSVSSVVLMVDFREGRYRTALLFFQFCLEGNSRKPLLQTNSCLQCDTHIISWLCFWLQLPNANGCQRVMRCPGKVKEFGRHGVVSMPCTGTSLIRFISDQAKRWLLHANRWIHVRLNASSCLIYAAKSKRDVSWKENKSLLLTCGTRQMSSSYYIYHYRRSCVTIGWR